MHLISQEDSIGKTLLWTEELRTHNRQAEKQRKTNCVPVPVYKNCVPVPVYKKFSDAIYLGRYEVVLLLRNTNNK